MCACLTGTAPQWTAGVRVDLNGHAQEVTLRLGDVESAVLGGVVKHQLPSKADVLTALINSHRERRLNSNKIPTEKKNTFIPHFLIRCILEYIIRFEPRKLSNETPL